MKSTKFTVCCPYFYPGYRFFTVFYQVRYITRRPAPTAAGMLNFCFSFTFCSPALIIQTMKQTSFKNKSGLSREQEQEASRLFGKHVSPPKALVTLIFSMLACAAPMLLGLRLWDRIPAVVESGLVTAEGVDDSMPRAVLVFGVPGLMCLLNLICHAQLWIHQKTETLPPTPVRMTGRWGVPVVGALLCSFWMIRAAGATTDPAFYAPILFGLLLMLLGAHFYDCTRESKFAFHFRRIEHWETPWRKTHRTAGFCWMLAGLLTLVFYFGLGTLPWYSFVLTLLLLLSEFPAAAKFSK